MSAPNSLQDFKLYYEHHEKDKGVLELYIDHVGYVVMNKITKRFKKKNS